MAYVLNQPVVIVLQGSGTTPALAVTALNAAIVAAQTSADYEQWSGTYKSTNSSGLPNNGPRFEQLTITSSYNGTVLDYTAACIMYAISTGTNS